MSDELRNTGSAGARVPRRLRVAARWVLVTMWACAIAFMSSNTGSNLDGGLGVFSELYRSLRAAQESVLGPDVDLLSPAAHFCEYALLGLLLVGALRQHMPLRRACLVALACASLFGVTDELHQSFVPGRLCDPLDWLVDTCGAALGAATAQAASRLRAGKRDPRPSGGR